MVTPDDFAYGLGAALVPIKRLHEQVDHGIAFGEHPGLSKVPFHGPARFANVGERSGGFGYLVTYAEIGQVAAAYLPFNGRNAHGCVGHAP